MGIATGTYLGGNSASTAVSSWSSALTAAPAVGECALIWVVTNNIATADGPSSTHTAFSGAGRTWTKLGEITASSGAAEDGVTISAWLSSPAESAGGTLSFTVDFSAPITFKVAQGRAISGADIGVDASAMRTNYAQTAYGSMTLSGLSSKERLWLRMSGGEYGASTNATPTSGWTVGSGVNTGSNTSGLMARNEYKVATSTGETSAFTQNIAVDSASIFVALSEGGGGETPPTLTGVVSFSDVTQTSYTMSWPAGSDDTGIAGYEYQIGSTEGAWTPAGADLSEPVSGRTPGATETVYVRAYDAAGLRSTPAISGEVTLESIPAAGINVTDPLKNNTGTVLASQSGVRVAVLQAADLVSVYEATGLTTNASGILATISNAAITTGQQYHVAIKLADGSVGITGPITAS